MLDRIFKLRDNSTTIRSEILAGITTFVTMAYIIVVNPLILKDAGMPFGAVMLATIVSAAFATLVMGLVANYPFALAPGMGLNAFFAYVVVLDMGLSWQAALVAVFISGVIFLLLTLTKAREAIINSIPMSLKYAVSVGIGLFIAFIGFKNAGLIISNEATILGMGSLKDSAVLLAVIGLVITGFLVVRGVKGALLIGIVLTTLIGIPMGVTKLDIQSQVLTTEAVGVILNPVHWKEVFEFGIIPIVFTFTFVDLFDTIGTFIGVSSKAGLLDENGRLPNANRALLADSLGSMLGAFLGTSTVTTYVESASGVAEGGRTGLTAVTTAVLFLLALIVAPIVAIVPSAATAPILIIVGIFMVEPVTKINFSDYLEAIPAFLTIVLMPFAFSIAEGIVFGILSYTILHALTGRFNKISITMWIMAILFVFKLVYYGS